MQVLGASDEEDSGDFLLVRGEDLDGSRSAGWARSGRSCRPMGLVASSAPREAAERGPGGKERDC